MHGGYGKKLQAFMGIAKSIFDPKTPMLVTSRAQKWLKFEDSIIMTTDYIQSKPNTIIIDAVGTTTAEMASAI